VHADDLREVIAGEAIGAADPGEGDQPPAGTVLDPPGGAAEHSGNVLGEKEARRRGGGV
jgi:hypothetical protein